MTSLDSNLTWGERDALYPKRFDYVFSLGVVFEMVVRPRLGSRVPLRMTRIAPDAWDTFHVLDEPFMRTPNGIQHEVPRARLVYGADSLSIQDEGAVSLDGSMVFETDTPDRLSMRYKGVLNVGGGTQRFCATSAQKSGPSGRISIASTQDIANPKYRWMVQSQLVGVGQMSSELVEATGNWRLTFDYDFHIAS